MIHNHSSGKCRSVKRFLAVCMAVFLICMISLNCIAAETDESVSETFTEEEVKKDAGEEEQELVLEEQQEDRSEISEKGLITEEPPTEENETDEELPEEEIGDQVEILEGDVSENTEEGQAVTLLSDGTEEPDISKVEILDSIRTEGCLYIKVTDPNGEEITAEQLKDAGYTIIWLRNGKEVARTKITGDSYNLAEDGSWLNVTLDQGAQKSYQVQIKKEDKTFQSGTCQIPYYDSLRNGSFEVPACTDKYQPYITGDTEGIVWKTTASDNQIEMVSASSNKMDGNSTHKDLSFKWHGMSAAAAGTQYAELNANYESSLYQDVLTTPGSTMHWQLYHAARLRNGNTRYTGSDQMYVVIMNAVKAENLSANQAQLVKVAKALAAGTTMVDGVDYSGAGSFLCSNNTGIWSLHNGSYVVPEGQYLTRYFFVSAASASGDITVGNHIDNVWFSTELPPVNPDLTTDITILKEVEGPMGDFQKEFHFTYSYVSGNGETITGDFVLKDHDADGESYILQDIPIGVQLSVTENNAGGYTTTATYLGQAVQEISGARENQVKTIKILAGEEKGELVITNEKDVIPDMGADLPGSFWGLAVVLASGGMALFYAEKRTGKGRKFYKIR